MKRLALVLVAVIALGGCSTESVVRQGNRIEIPKCQEDELTFFDVSGLNGCIPVDDLDPSTINLLTQASQMAWEHF